jgi:hypothetical protein
MPVVALTGQDTLIINGTIITSLADANAVDITPAADIVTVKRGKDSNVLYATNEEGYRALMTVRLAFGSVDDNTFISLLAQQKAGLSSFALMTGAFYKRVGDGNQNMTATIYQLSGGVIKAMPEALTTAEGNVDQSVHIWNINWGNCDISVQ